MINKASVSGPIEKVSLDIDHRSDRRVDDRWTDGPHRRATRSTAAVRSRAEDGGDADDVPLGGLQTHVLNSPSTRGHQGPWKECKSCCQIRQKKPRSCSLLLYWWDGTDGLPTAVAVVTCKLVA